MLHLLSVHDYESWSSGDLQDGPVGSMRGTCNQAVALQTTKLIFKNIALTIKTDREFERRMRFWPIDIYHTYHWMNIQLTDSSSSSASSYQSDNSTPQPISQVWPKEWNWLAITRILSLCRKLFTPFDFTPLANHFTLFCLWILDGLKGNYLVSWIFLKGCDRFCFAQRLNTMLNHPICWNGKHGSVIINYLN